MSKRILIRSLIAVLLLISIPGYGCPPPEITPPRRPELREITHQWGEVTSQTAEIITTIIVYNPNPFVLPVKRVQTELFVAGVKVGVGESKELEMKAGGEFPIYVTTIIQREKISQMWVEHLNLGEVSEILLKGELVFDLFITEFTMPLPDYRRTMETHILGQLEGILRVVETTEIAPFGEVVPFSIVIQSIQAVWGEVSKEKTELRLVAVVYNDSDFPVTVSSAPAEVALDGAVAGEGMLVGEYRLLSPRAITEVEIILALDTAMMVDLFMPRVENGEKAIFSLRASLVLNLPPEMVAKTGKNIVEVEAFEISGEFNTGLLRGMLGHTAE